jgi:hypothetical protein
VRVSVPGLDSAETPVAGVGLVALPYDRDSVLAALEARARTPRPNTAPLDTAFAEFRGPFVAYADAVHDLTTLGDSLATLRRRLDSLPRGAPEYRALYERFAAASDSVAAARARSEGARTALAAARTAFVERSESLRARVRQWEDSTYAGYDSIVRALVRARARDPVADTTDAAGWARLRLPPGRWWVYARAWDVGDPNAEWYWNVPVTGDTLLLSSRTGRRKPRY